MRGLLEPMQTLREPEPTKQCTHYLCPISFLIPVKIAGIMSSQLMNIAFAVYSYTDVLINHQTETFASEYNLHCSVLLGAMMQGMGRYSHTDKMYIKLCLESI